MIRDRQTGQTFTGPADAPFDSGQYEVVPSVTIRDRQTDETFIGPADAPFDPSQYEILGPTSARGAEIRTSLVRRPERTATPLEEFNAPFQEAATGPLLTEALGPSLPAKAVQGLERGARFLAAPFAGAGRVAEQAVEQTPRLVGQPAVSTPISRTMGQAVSDVLPIALGAIRGPEIPEIPIPLRRLAPESMEAAIAPSAAVPENPAITAIVEAAIPRTRVRIGPGGTKIVEPTTGPPQPVIPIAGSAPGGLTDPILTLPIHKTILSAAEDLLTTGGVARDPTRLISDQVTELLGSGRLTNEQVNGILARHNTTFTALADGLFRPAVRNAAQRLQALSALSQRLAVLGKTPAGQAELETLQEIARDLDPAGRLGSWWRRADNVRRGLLVTQLATAVRNAETQVVRVGLDTLQTTLDAGLQRLFPGKATVHPADAFGVWLNLARRGTKADVEQILQAFPHESDRLFSVYSSDIARRTRAGAGMTADKVFSAAERATAVLNTMNTFQEYTIRRATFLAQLSQRTRARGQDLVRLAETGKLNTIPLEDIRASIDRALEITFATQPKFNTSAYHFVRLVNGTPLSFLIPFPRFMVNSLKFFLDWSPTGFLKLLSKAERAKIAAGDTTAISRAIIGTGMLGAAWQIRNSRYAGERWYEVRLSDGRTVDMRPFNPFASYLFVADVIKRKMEGRLNTFSSKDVAMGVLSTNFRAGVGLFAVDQVLGGLSEFGSGEKALDAIKSFAGEAVGGLLTPLRQVEDVLAAFDAQQQVVRNRRLEPFLGPIKANIPQLVEQAGGTPPPPLGSPTHAGPIVRESPLLRQALGLSINAPKNPLEHELDRLGFERKEILPSTGSVEADHYIALAMGPLAQAQLVPFVTSPRYRAADDARRGEELSLVLSVIRRAATAQALGAHPDLFQKLYFENRPARLRFFLESQGIGGRR
jgi:hypothetical protein